ncbi:MAG: CRTAC1 family protein [Acidobacteria bacterium]|nr:CRTAC1 family protein [Acidobacteriota bacterium]
MAERLEAVAASRLSLFGNPHHNAARLEALLALPPAADPGDQLIFEGSVAGEMLRAGRTADAIAAFERLVERLDGLGGNLPADLPEGFREVMRRSLAIGYLQLAQHENCLPPNPAARCAIPPGAAGPHPNQEALRRAISLYERIATEESDDADVRWGLNIAYMWAGEHPDGVPPQWLIPPEAFGSDQQSAEVAGFVNAAPWLGLDTVGLAGGSVMEDFDNDGDLDLMASSWGLRDPLRYLRNDADCTFADATVTAGLEGIVGGLNLEPADYDNDGDVDVLVLRGAWVSHPHPNSLLRNDGDGSFTDVTEEAGLLRGTPTQTADWGDYDNDGDVDLFVGNESLGEIVYPSQLFRNDGDGSFTDVAYAAGVQVVGFVKAVTWGDYDNDGRLDLYVSRLDETNLLFRNEGPSANGEWTFRDVSVAAGVDGPLNSFPTWFFDYDNDGWLDLFVAAQRASLDDVAVEHLGGPAADGHPVLYRNRGDGTFEDVTAVAGLATIMPTMGSNFGDLDNDGHPDLYLGTGDPTLEMLVPNRVFRNTGGRFDEVTAAGNFGHVQKGHGVSFGDIDHDGDQDVFMVLGGAFEGDLAQNILLLNPGHGHAWVTLRLRGTSANRLGIGARIAVEVDTPRGPRTIHALAGSGGSFGASTLQQEIGLGDATRIRELRVVWPGSGRRDRWRDVPLNRFLLVREGARAVGPLPVQPIRLDAAACGAAGR